MKLRGILIFLGICGLVALVGCDYQIRATAADLKAHPALGRMVNVNGLNYHLNCIGTGLFPSDYFGSRFRGKLLKLVSSSS